MAAFKVLIIGAGLGGLTLAQSLRRAHIEFDVFERDRSAWDRSQGYRLHLDADALNAVREALPPALHALFEATSYRTEPFTTLLNTNLSMRKRLPTHDEFGASGWETVDPQEHYNVDRATLRQLLLAGLDECVHFGRRLSHYDASAEGVTAHFTDGSIARGDVLVGADGIHSAVRAQRAPHAQIMDAGVQALYGRIPMEAARPWVPGETLSDIFTIATDARKAFLGLGAVRFPTPPEQAAHAVPGLALRPQSDYVVCIVGARREVFDELALMPRDAPGAQLQRAALAVLGAWPAQAQQIVHAADPESFFRVDMSSSVPCQLGAPERVTVLGDAIHAMTPTLGRGANLAMRDGVLLGRALRSVCIGDQHLPAALADYEASMLRYGFGVVQEAARVGAERMAQNPLPDQHP